MDFVPAFGRWEDPEHTEKFFASQRHPTVTAATSAWTGVDDNADIDLCAIYERVAGKIWNSLNQNPRGFCVGFGNAKIATLQLAVLASLNQITFPGDVAVEPVYGGMRYEIGKQKYNSSLYRGDDGGVGSWAAEWLTGYGVLLKQVYGTTDLTEYSMNRCDEFGSRGVPDDIEDDAKQHPFDTSTLVETGDDAWKMLGQLYGLVHCSNQGFAMSRDSSGICRAVGSWAHCAGWSGRFTLKGGIRVLRYDNSWEGDRNGNGYLGSPITIQGQNGPIKLNGCQFLVPLDIVDRICRSGRETFAFGGNGKFAMNRPLFFN